MSTTITTRHTKKILEYDGKYPVKKRRALTLIIKNLQAKSAINTLMVVHTITVISSNPEYLMSPLYEPVMRKATKKKRKIVTHFKIESLSCENSKSG